jgi:hypothetical protein
MIVWRFWITLKDNLPQEEIDKFRKRFPNLFFEVNGLYRVDIDADTHQEAEFMFKNIHNLYPLIGDAAVQKIEIEPRMEKRQFYFAQNLDDLL